MVIKNYSILDIFWMLWENFKWLLYIWLFLCRVRRLFWSAPSFQRWRDQNFTPSAQAGSPPSLEVSWQHTYYTRYSNTHFRCRNLGNDVFKRFTLMNATYFFGNDLFTLGLVFFRGGGLSLRKLAYNNTTIPMAAYNTYSSCTSKSYAFLRWIFIIYSFLCMNNILIRTVVFTH